MSRLGLEITEIKCSNCEKVVAYTYSDGLWVQYVENHGRPAIYCESCKVRINN